MIIYHDIKAIIYILIYLYIKNNKEGKTDMECIQQDIQPMAWIIGGLFF